MIVKKGAVTFPSSFLKIDFYRMEPDSIEGRIQNFVGKYIEQWPDVFWVGMSVTKASNKITVLLDGDAGMNIDRCADVNRKLYKFMEGGKLFGEENFSIEVSSPGIDRPLTLLRQFKKNVGRKVEVIRLDASVLSGALMDANEEQIVVNVELKENKKKISQILTTIPFTEIRQVKVLVTF